jgi:iron(III) transport system ATP-binding protein
VRLGEIELDLPHRDLAPGEVHLAIRPQAISLSIPGTQNARLEGVVDKASYVGSHIEYIVTTALGELFVIDARIDAPFAVGANVAIAFAERGSALVGN